MEARDQRAILAKALGISAQMQEYSDHIMRFKRSEKTMRNDTLGKKLADAFPQLSQEDSQFSNLELFHLLLDKDMYNYSIDAVYTLVEYEYSRIQKNRVGGEIVARIEKTGNIGGLGKQVIETIQESSTVSSALSEDQKMQIAKLQELAQLDPDSDEGKEKVRALFTRPHSIEEMKFFLFLFAGMTYGGNIIPKDVERKENYSPQAAALVRKAGENLYVFFSHYYWMCLNKTFHAKELESDYPRDTMAPFMLFTEFVKNKRYILPQHFTQLVRGDFIPGVPEDVTEYVIRLYRDEFSATKEDSLHQLTDEAKVKPYSILTTAYEAGSDEAFYDDLVYFHQDDEPVELDTMLKSFVFGENGQDRYLSLNEAIHRRGVQCFFPNDEHISQIDIAAPFSNFIDIIVLGHEQGQNKTNTLPAFALQIDIDGRVIGIPQPCTKDAEKVVAHIMKLVIEELKERGFIARTRRVKQEDVRQEQRVRDNQSMNRSNGNTDTNSKQTTPDRETRMRLYEEISAQNPHGTTNNEKQDKVDEKTRLLMSLGLDPNGSEEARSKRKGFRLAFPADAVKSVRKIIPGYEKIVIKALDHVRKEMQASQTGLFSPSLRTVKTKEDRWYIEYHYEGVWYRIFLKKRAGTDGVLDVMEEGIEPRTGTTWGRRFIDN